MSTYPLIIVLKLFFTFKYNMRFIILQKNVMGIETLANEKLPFVRHFENKNSRGPGSKQSVVWLCIASWDITSNQSKHGVLRRKKFLRFECFGWQKKLQKYNLVSVFVDLFLHIHGVLLSACAFLTNRKLAENTILLWLRLSVGDSCDFYHLARKKWNTLTWQCNYSYRISVSGLCSRLATEPRSLTIMWSDIFSVFFSVQKI